MKKINRLRALGFFGGLLCVIILQAPSVVQADELRGIFHNNQGVKSAKDKKPLEAYKLFNSALIDVPYSPEVHYNLGNAFLENKEYEKALSEYQQALKAAGTDSAHDRQLRFYAYFNSAVALTEMKQVDIALSYYQEALDLNPTSIETKTNIELLIQQGGQGEGEGKDQKDPKDQKGQGQKKPQPQDGKDKKPSPDQGDQKKEPSKPKPFQGKELNQQDVNRILEELKRQEDSIREKMQKEGPKDAPRDKDW